MDISKVKTQEAVDIRLSHLVGTVYSGHRLATWAFSERTGKLHFNSAPYEEQMEKLLRMGGCYDYAFTKAKELDVPFLMSDQMGVVWLGEYAQLDGQYRMLVLIGPMFYTNVSQERIGEILRWMTAEKHILPEEVSLYRAVMREIPAVSPQTAVSYARMLHFGITQKTLANSDIHYQSGELQQDSAAEEMQNISWADYSLVHSQEELFLQCVREGNLNYMEVLNGLNYAVLDVPLSKDPVRSELYQLVKNAALCSRAAVEGGLSPKTAFELENVYLRKADKIHTVTQLRELNLKLLDDFIRHVHEAKTNSGCSRQIRECCEYIDMHLTDDLSTQTIAKAVGYAEYYLTRKFQKEMGIRLVDYIKEARIEYARVCLISTQLSVEEISDLLQFSSRNYFTRVFREKTGRTPTEFRTQNSTD